MHGNCDQEFDDHFTFEYYRRNGAQFLELNLYIIFNIFPYFSPFFFSFKKS